MDKQVVTRLGRWLRDPEAAQVLAEAGIDTPAKVKAAEKAELERVLGKTRAGKLRGRGKKK